MGAGMAPTRIAWLLRYDDPVAQLRTCIVEDSPLIRDSLVATLEELLPVKVVGIAEDAPSALAWLGDAANTCDLWIIDIFLKRGSGLDVVAAARAASKAVKLVVLTNYATPEMRKKCLAVGADEVFDKSNDIDALISYCERLPAAADEPGTATGASAS